MEINVAMALERLVPAAEYFGSLTENSEEAYKKVRWMDKREKPTWEAILKASDVHKTEKKLQEEEKILLAYLASTDWYAVRSLEVAAKAEPEDVRVTRQKARDRISEIRGILSTM